MYFYYILNIYLTFNWCRKKYLLVTKIGKRDKTFWNITKLLRLLERISQRKTGSTTSDNKEHSWCPLTAFKLVRDPDTNCWFFEKLQRWANKTYFIAFKSSIFDSYVIFLLGKKIIKEIIMSVFTNINKLSVRLINNLHQKALFWSIRWSIWCLKIIKKSSSFDFLSRFYCVLFLLSWIDE